MPESFSDEAVQFLPQRPVVEEPPPFLGSWPRVYAGVLLYLAGVLLMLSVISRAFHYK